jgi:hypothetical protein
MATKRFLGRAGAVVQVDKIAVAGGAFAATETVSVVIGNSTLTVALGTGQTTSAAVATVIKNAINARSIDENLAGTETRYTGGQQLAEFNDVEAIVDPASSSNVLVRSKVPGVPFGVPNSGGPINPMTVSTTSGAGTLTRSSVQSATGPWHWNNATNWDSGTVPVNNDVTVFRDSNTPCKYGLPNNSLEVTIQQWQNHTGWIGLPELNTDNPGRSYYEYRQRDVKLDDSGSGVLIQHRFGLGKDGTGSQLINVTHSTLPCAVTVFNTGAPLRTGLRALNLSCAASSTLNVIAGSVDFAGQFMSVDNISGDIRGKSVPISTLNSNGGYVLVGDSSLLDTVVARGGTLRIEDQDITILSMSIFGNAVVDYASFAGINDLLMYGGTFDARNANNVTISDAALFSPSKIIDPYGNVAFSTPISIQYDISGDLQLGGSSSTPLSLTR